MKVLL